MPATAQVLLIEDEKMDRDLVQELVALKARGRVHVTEAGDLKAGLVTRAATLQPPMTHPAGTAA